METAAQILSSLRKGQDIYRMLTFLNLATFLWPQQATVGDGARYDFVIVGGGTAGCIIASELARLNCSVLLIEAGGKPPLEAVLPGEFPYLKETEYDWNFTSVRNETFNKYHNGKVTEVQQGKVLGGSSTINYMQYGIGNPKDYDEWAKITNDCSWKFKNLCKFFKKSEKLTDEIVLDSPDRVFHGTKGKTEIMKYYAKINDEYFEAYEELGNNIVRDINPKNPLGYTSAYVNIGNRVRQSTAYSYIFPVKDNPYLHVLYYSLATKIIFNRKKQAVGVRILTKDKELITVRANNEVIVTAGAIKSPQLLMLSGIGPRNHLESQGIEVISDLPVGEQLQDHPTCPLIYRMGEARPVPFLNPHEFPVSVIDGYVAVDQSDRADYQTLSGVIVEPIFFLQVCAFVFNFKEELCDHLYKKLNGRQVYYVKHKLLHPSSRGNIRLNSTDPEDNPIINPQYYSNLKDLEDHARYIEHYSAIVNTTFFKSVDSELVDPEFDICDGLERGTEAYWKCYVQGFSTTLNNYVGTCAMGSVTDSRLRVKGVKRLRVADSSIMPKIVGSSVMASVLMIALKLIDILIKDYHLCAQ